MFADGPSSINRFDGDHSATIQADIVGNAPLGDVEATLNKMPLMQHLPPGIKVTTIADAPKRWKI